MTHVPMTMMSSLTVMVPLSGPPRNMKPPRDAKLLLMMQSVICSVVQRKRSHRLEATDETVPCKSKIVFGQRDLRTILGAQLGLPACLAGLAAGTTD